MIFFFINNILLIIYIARQNQKLNELKKQERKEAMDT